jgi:hypothetical protein
MAFAEEIKESIKPMTPKETKFIVVVGMNGAVAVFKKLS